MFSADLCLLVAANNYSLCYNKKEAATLKPLIMKKKFYPWKIEPFSKKADEKKSMNALKAGDYIKLFHQEREAFLNVRYRDYRKIKPKDGEDISGLTLPERLFDRFLPETLANEDKYNVHVRLSDCIKKSKENVSCTNIFKVELLEQIDGSKIVWGQPVRIKHMLSNTYVAVKHNQHKDKFEVVLTDTHLGTDNLFMFYPMASAQIKSYATVSSHARIRHVNTKLFLGVEDNKL